MVLADRRWPERPSWSELEDRGESLDQLFSDAVAAVDSARRAGRLTDEQADTLLRGIIAVTLEAKLNITIGSVVEQSLHIMGSNGDRSWDIFSPL